LREQVWVGLGHADDLDFGTVSRLIEESVHVPVNQTDDADAKRRANLRRGSLAERKRGA
jgi:hypothetical protein